MKLPLMVSFSFGTGLVIAGCITKPQNLAATQPSTVMDLATTQPSYWLDQPAAAQVQAANFDALWADCKSVARGYLFSLDRTDYRIGLITTAPLVSKQWFEPWRPDTGEIESVFANSLATIRRTLRFEIAKNEDGTFTITPKVLVERETILERHVTDVSQYRYAFSGPLKGTAPKYAVTLDPDTYQDIPVKYWYPVGRDTKMEAQVADRLRRALTKSSGESIAPVPIVAVRNAPFTADGTIAAVGLSGTIYVNLGSVDKIVPGMTFELYDAHAALPTLDQYTKENPGAKGWIEVTAVAATSSTCKVIHAARKEAPIVGDQLFNFIYERGRQKHLVLTGDFTSADRETLAGLVWRWNGVIDNGVTAETDYVVMGQSPNDTPSRAIYDQIKAKAVEAKIPVINEDKLNLLVRYYDPSKR